MRARRELSTRQMRYFLRLHHDGEARNIGRLLGVARYTGQSFAAVLPMNLVRSSTTLKNGSFSSPAHRLAGVSGPTRSNFLLG